MVLSCFVNTLSPLWNILHNNTNQSRFLHIYTQKVHLPHIYHYNQYPIYPSGSNGTLPLVRFIWTCAEYTESSYDKHTITTEILSDYYICTLERSICLIINTMINIQYISHCVIQISNSVRFTRHAVSLDYRYSSVSKTTRGPDGTASASRLSFTCCHDYVKVTHLKVTQKAAQTLHKARNPYIHQISHYPLQHNVL